MGLSKDPIKRAQQIANLKPMKKGDKGRNPTGKRSNPIQSIINEMIATGYAIPTKEEIREGLIACAFGNEEQIKAMVTDKSKPMALRVIAKQVLSNDGFNAIEKVLDRVVGKVLDIQTNGKDIVKPDPIVVQVIDSAEQVQQNEEE